MDYGGKEATKKNSEETLGGLSGQQLGRLIGVGGGRRGAVLRDICHPAAATLSEPYSWPPEETLGQRLCSTGNKVEKG